MDDIATKFLQAYAGGGEAEEGWMYGKALQQARLDHSPESLVRLDALLTQIRERAQPTPAQLASPQGRNFAALLAFYLIETARQRTHADIAWHDRDSAQRVLPPGAELPDKSSARLVALAPDHGAIFYPLAWLEAQLLPDGERIGTVDYVAGLVARLERDGPAEWWRAAYATGQIASWQMQQLAHGRPAFPTMVSQKAPRVVETLGSRNDTAEAIQRAAEQGVQRLASNPGGAAWQVFSYHGFADRDGARLGAVLVFAATYGPKPMRMVVTFPYRPSKDGQGFAILRPAVSEADVPVEALRQLNGPLERGIRDLDWSLGGNWAALYRG